MIFTFMNWRLLRPPSFTRPLKVNSGVFVMPMITAPAWGRPSATAPLITMRPACIDRDGFADLHRAAAVRSVNILNKPGNADYQADGLTAAVACCGFESHNSSVRREVLLQNEPNRVPNPMTAASAMSELTTPTMTMST